MVFMMHKYKHRTGCAQQILGNGNSGVVWWIHHVILVACKCDSASAIRYEPVPFTVQSSTVIN